MAYAANIHETRCKTTRPGDIGLSRVLLSAIAIFSLFPTAHADNAPPFEYMVTKIDVSNLDESLRFYSEFLGYQEVIRTKPSAEGSVQVYTTRGGKNFRDGLTFVYTPGQAISPKTPGLHTLVFSITNLEETLRKMAAAGYRVVSPAKETKAYATAISSSVVIAYVADPDGYRVELVEWKP
jgi:catechol 2,3-dioxygenase-like lactoylglutathione lyase family enzyme